MLIGFAKLGDYNLAFAFVASMECALSSCVHSLRNCSEAINYIEHYGLVRERGNRLDATFMELESLSQ